jgi:valyl-tRNA synthetase
LNSAIEEVTAALREYRFHEVAQTLYHFFWDDFCDWYIELSKPLVASQEDSVQVRDARSRIAYVLETSLRLLHPVMPFITEELWQRLPHEGESISVASFPVADSRRHDPEAESRMTRLIALITRVRNIRAEMNIPPSAAVTVHVATGDAAARTALSENTDYLKRLARVAEIVLSDSLPKIEKACRDVVAGMEIAVPLADLIDYDKERERLKRELSRKEDEARSLASRLDNHSFRERAPEDVVKQTRARHDELIAEIGNLRNTLQAIG